MPSNLTVFEAIQRLFPGEASNGDAPYYTWPRIRSIPREYDGPSALPKEVRKKYAMAPLLPFDVFAVCAYLLELSGAYHHVAPVSVDHSPKVNSEIKRLLHVSPERIRGLRDIAVTWRKELEYNKHNNSLEALKYRRDELSPLIDRWDELIGKFGGCDVFGYVASTSEPPEWWDIVLELFIIADEAALGVGFTLPVDASMRPAPDPAPWFERAVMYIFIDELAKRMAASSAKSNDDSLELKVVRMDWLNTLSSACMDIATVLPKARTTAVGCTLRSLSHHLAFLPPRGVARGQWTPCIAGSLPDEWELNVLLIPLPYSLTEHMFNTKAGFFGETKRWGFFDVEQCWLDSYGGPDPRNAMLNQLVKFTLALAEVAKKEHGAKSINMIVFPELALDDKIFQGLSGYLSNELPELELLIAGVSSNPDGRKGNFVAVTAFPRSLQGRVALQTVREKHHRWKLDESQLKDYGLDTVLNPKLVWWEGLDLMSRRVDFTVFRPGSVLAAMICEDLARVDPCQELLRAIGPNIVVALLMDAPQLATRWPARYATVLAEDPGSAVLTLTSRAMMTHQHSKKIYQSKSADDRVIALWRDDRQLAPREISCPVECQGVWLKLWGGPTIDTTIDGRNDASAISWQYSHHTPLEIDNAEGIFAEILGPQDIKIRQENKLRKP